MSWREVGVCAKCGLLELIDDITYMCKSCEDEIEIMLLNALNEGI
jgi:uncharacterized protein YlaI